MNNQSLMMIKKPDAGICEYADISHKEAGPDFAGYQSGTAMLRRDGAALGGNGGEVLEKQIPNVPPMAAAPDPGPAAPEKPVLQAASANGADAAKAKLNAIKAQAAKAVSQAPDAGGAGGQPKAQAAPAQKPAGGAAAPAAKPTAKPVRYAEAPDGLCQQYIQAFKDTLGLNLSTAIVFDNMRRICEADVKDPSKTLFFLENTYRVSTVLYLSANLPILVVTSILAEKNRKNILKYVTTEVENGAKPYEDLLALRVRRWSRKYENMAVNDAMTITPGATKLSGPLAAQCRARLADISAKLRRFNNDLTQMVAKFDDATRNDVTFIYSNWWYLLQGFENVPEMRTYVMAITDDTRKNLKL